MARRDEEGVYVEKPKADVYLWMIVLTFVMTTIAAIILYIEWSIVAK